MAPVDQSQHGTIGVYQANWGGHRTNKALNTHINNDVIIGNPCQIIAAQEVDACFVQALQRGGSSNASVRGRASPAVAGYPPASAVAGGPAMCYDFRDKTRTWCENSWLVAAGVEEGKTNIVAGKASIFKSVSVLEWVKVPTGTYRSKNRKTVLNAFSRVLVAELVFAHPWCGRSRLRVACVHVHYKAAKTDPAAAASDHKCHAHAFWTGLKFCLWRTKPDLLCGDFNMALYAVPYILTRGDVWMPKWPLLLSSYVWVKEGVAGAILEEDEGDNDNPSPRLRKSIGPPQPPPPPPPPPPARKIDRPVSRPPPKGIPPKPTRQPPGAPCAYGDYRLKTGEAVPLLTTVAVAEQTAVAGRSSADVVSSAVAGEEAEEDEEHVDPQTLMFDSCGIFALWSTAHVRRSIPVRAVNGTAPKGLLERCTSGQGYGMQSYKRMPEGWWEAITPLEQPVPEPCDIDAKVATGRRDSVPKHNTDFKWEQLPAIREKLADRSLFDGSQLLFTSGAHMPLMVFLGSQSRRSDAALERRAAKRRSKSHGRRGSPAVAALAAVAASASGPTTSSAAAAASDVDPTPSSAANGGPVSYSEMFV
jgi:hypothetical protein